VARETFEAQVALLVRVLPHVAGESVFALKGGTAINLFYRDLPRLSVDIDLTYLPIKERAESLDEINAAMDRIAASIETGIRGAKLQRILGGGAGATRLLARLETAEIKIETSPVARGVVHHPEIRAVSAAVEDAYGYAEMQIVSFEDLFAGKLHAALDRQHPRDLYDVTLLYDNEGLTQELFHTFLIYVASSPRPAHELLDPNLIDLAQPYAREFEGMTRIPVPLDILLATRKRMVADLQSRLDVKARQFLLTLHDGAPDFAVIDRSQAADLPAVKWKLLNLSKLKRDNPKKHAAQREELLKLLGGPMPRPNEP
jgi:predicted nucleotidyltransferase component of viral defense system